LRNLVVDGGMTALSPQSVAMRLHRGDGGGPAYSGELTNPFVEAVAF
jgi:hypothetical protein